MSNSTVQKAWSRPQLVRLGTIGDVASATSTACQTVNGSGGCGTSALS